MPLGRTTHDPSIPMLTAKHTVVGQTNMHSSYDRVCWCRIAEVDSE